MKWVDSQRQKKARETTALSLYDGISDFKPCRVVDCKAIEDVRSAVVTAVDSRLRVRAMGAGFSWAPHFLSPDVCLKLGGLNRIHGVDITNKTVVVDAGARLGNVSRVLAAHGLAIPSLSFFPDITVGGAVATGTHGTSPKWGTLSDFVRSMHIVLASGEVREIGPESPPEQIRAARTAIGMLGVIVRLEFQAFDMPWVSFDEFNLDLAAFRSRLPAILAQYDHVWAHWTIGDDRVRVECLEARSGPVKGFHRYVENGRGCWRPPSSLAVRLLRPGARGAQNFWRRISSPSTVPPGLAPLVRTRGDRWVWMSMQYGVPAFRLDKAIELIRASDLSATHPGQAVELKFLKGGDSYLGPNADGDAVLFNLWWLVDEKIKFDVFQHFEQAMRSIHARPHWGKQHRPPDAGYMREAYPKWTEFEAVRAKFDPGGVFSIDPKRQPDTA